MHVLRHVDHDTIEIDFLVHSNEQTGYDQEARMLGARILVCSSPTNPVRYARDFKNLISQNEPYDVIHSHVYHFSGYVLFLAARMGIPVRIAHSHNDYRQTADSEPGILRRGYIRLMSELLRRFPTSGLATSEIAATALFGEDWDLRNDREVLHCGVDLAGFGHDWIQGQTRAELGLSQDTLVLCQIARFVFQKNHSFSLEIAARLDQVGKDFHLLLIGGGVLDKSIRNEIMDRGLQDKVTILDDRDDIPELLTTVVDILLLPSLNEGLGLVLIEAQAAGKPAIASNVVPSEAAIVPGLVTRLPLDANAWVEQIDYISQSLPIVDRAMALNLVRQSDFEVSNSVFKLQEHYWKQLLV